MESTLQFRNVGRFFPTPRGPIHVLRDVNLDVQPSDFIALTGPSGSGKSTLLHLAGLLDGPTSGEVFFDGKLVSGLREKARSDIRKRGIGMVFQQFHLLGHRTALENVAFRFRYMPEAAGEATARARAMMEELNLLPVAETPAHLLSGGEMQRVAVARAVACRPKLLLADEPTGNLDSESARHVMDLLRQVNRGGAAVILATHNLALIEGCNKHWICRDGNVTESRL